MTLAHSTDRMTAAPVGSFMEFHHAPDVANVRDQRGNAPPALLSASGG